MPRWADLNEDRGCRPALPNGWKRWTTRFAIRHQIMDKAKRTASRSSSGSTRRACTSSRISPPKYAAMAQLQKAGRREAGIQLDIIGLVMKKLGHGRRRQPIVVSPPTNGTEVFTWPDAVGRVARSPREQSSRAVSAARDPSWPGHSRSVQNGISPAWLAPDFSAAQSEHRRRIAEGQDDWRPVQEPSGWLHQMPPSCKGPSRVTKSSTSRKHGRAVRLTTISIVYRASPLAGGEKTHPTPDRPYNHNQTCAGILSKRRPRLARIGRKDGAQQYFDWYIVPFARFIDVRRDIDGQELKTYISYRRCRGARVSNLTRLS